MSRSRRAGEGYLSQSGIWEVLGCGSADSANLVVHWPGGEAEDFGELVTGRRYLLIQGSGRARRASAPSAAPADGEPKQGEGGPDQAGEDQAGRLGHALVLASGMPLPSMEMLTADGRSASLFGLGPAGSRGTGRPLLIHLWASWCAPCLEELAGVGQRADEIQAAGVDLLALSVDEASARPAALDALDRLGWPGSRGFATLQTAELLDALVAAVSDRSDRLPLPTSLLVGPGGRLLKIYTGQVTPRQLLLDIELVELAPEERLRRAMPYDGLYLLPPAGPDLAQMEQRLRRRGLEQAATEYALAQVEVRSVDEAQLSYEFGVARARQGRTEEALDLFRKAVELDPGKAAAWSALGWAAETQQEAEEALAAYRKAVALEGKDPTARFNLGRLALLRGEAQEAQSQIEALDRLQPDLAAQLRKLQASAQNASGGSDASGASGDGGAANDGKGGRR